MKQITVADQVRHGIELMAPEFEKALPPHIDVKRFIRIAQTAIVGNPNLLKCDRRSLYQACTKAAQDGLLPDGREGAIVPYGDKAQWMPMIAGILKKIRNSGELLSITAQIVKERDQFRRWVDSDGEHLEHEPVTFGDGGKVIGVYALAKTKDGGLYIDAMGVPDVEKVRAVSKSKDGTAWKNWWDEMAKKTVLRRLAKFLPVSSDNLDFIRRDEDQPASFEPTLVPVEAPPTVQEGPTQPAPSRLEKAISGSKVAPPPSETEEDDPIALMVDQDQSGGSAGTSNAPSEPPPPQHQAANSNEPSVQQSLT